MRESERASETETERERERETEAERKRERERERERESSPRDMHASTQQFRPPVLAVQTPTDSREGLQQPPPSGHISPSPRCHMPALARRPEEGLLKELRPAAPHSASSVGGAIFFKRALAPLR